jgi:NAD-dependent deacetylase
MSEKTHLVVLSGSGMSAESGVPTFRGSGGLWQGHRFEDVATPEAWNRQPELVLEFYNQRRRQILEVQPNQGHRILADLERYFRVSVVTQNVDDLHERAGSTEVLHLHGLITEARSSTDPDRTYPIDGWELRLGERCEFGSQLRPNIVWFGEPVTKMDEALEICQQADILIVVGTSLQVYPAAGLIHDVPGDCQRFIVDPEIPQPFHWDQWQVFPTTASEGLAQIRQLLI